MERLPEVCELCGGTGGLGFETYCSCQKGPFYRTDNGLYMLCEEDDIEYIRGSNDYVMYLDPENKEAENNVLFFGFLPFYEAEAPVYDYEKNWCKRKYKGSMEIFLPK